MRKRALQKNHLFWIVILVVCISILPWFPYAIFINDIFSNDAMDTTADEVTSEMTTTTLTDTTDTTVDELGSETSAIKLAEVDAEQDSTYLDYPNAHTTVNGISYVAVYGYSVAGKLTVLNATNSSHITYISSKQSAYTNHLESTEATSDGQYVYTVQRNWNGSVSMYNATNPLHLIRMTSRAMNTSCRGMYLEMDEQENFLYVGADNYMKIYNITNKSAGQLDYVGCIYLHDVCPYGIFWRQHIVGDTLYCPVGYHAPDASMNNKGLRIYDISNRSSPEYKNSLNWTTTYAWDCHIFMHSNGFQYLVFGGFSQYTPFKKTLVQCYNISAGNATFPVYMWTLNTLYPGGNMSNSFGAVFNDYLILRNENYNTSAWNSGICVYNLTDINHPTLFTRLSGIGSPNYLSTIHYIDGDKNNSDRSVYLLSMNNDAFISLDWTWNNASSCFQTDVTKIVP